jgi:hypothetical protein
MHAERQKAFVKFFGPASNRSMRSRTVLDTVATSGSHRICTYPAGRRPRAVRDGDLMFIGHLVSGPNDILVYGRGIARAYEEGASWLSEEFGAAFSEFGQLSGNELEFD